jgi:hypothetical protein
MEIQQSAAAEASANQNLPPKNLLASSSKSSISCGKQGGGATVLKEGFDIVTGETCVPTSLNVNNLGKRTVLSSVAETIPNSACH